MIRHAPSSLPLPEAATFTQWRTVINVLAGFIFVLWLTGAATAATFTVTNLNDSGAGSLRQAIADANSNAGVDQIVFAGSALPGTLHLTSGELLVQSEMTIVGPGPATLSVDAGLLSRVIYVKGPTNWQDPVWPVTISGLTLTRGSTSGVYNEGGCIRNEATQLTLQNVRIASCSADLGGGLGVAGNNGATTVVLDSTIENNDATMYGGGGIYNFGARLTIQRSVIRNNTAQAGGGVLLPDTFPGEPFTLSDSVITGNSTRSSGPITGSLAGSGGGVGIATTILGNAQYFFTRSLIANNSAANLGGGVYFEGSGGDAVVFENSTLSGNSAISGGGLAMHSDYALSIFDMEFRNSTVSANSSSGASSGAVLLIPNSPPGNIRFDNAVVSGNAGGVDLDASGTTVPSYNSFFSTLAATTNIAGTGNQIAASAMLGALANNGGPVVGATGFQASLGSMAPGAGSPLIDHGDNALVPMGGTDQRGAGFPRIVGAAVDIGAIEWAAPLADLSTTKTDGVTSVTPGGSVTYTIVASNAGPSNAPGSTVADTFPAALTATWTCVGAAGGTCTASGSGNINDTVNLPAGGSVTYTLTATVSGAASGTLSNTATVTAGTGITDPTPGNNSATDSDTVTVAATADLAITLTDAPDPVIAGAHLTYSITVSNAGPSAAATASWSDTLPAGTTFVSLNTVALWSCTTPAVGANGTVACNKASLASAGSAAFSLVVAVAPATPAGTVLTNTVTVSSATSDPTPGNNSATTTTTVTVNFIDPPPPEVTIPLLGISPACGLVAWPSIVNLSAGEGPAFAADMVAILSNAVGMPLRWVEQTAACGSVVLSGYNGGNLAFIPYGFLSGDGRPNGIYPVGNGQYHLVRNGQQLTLAPALVHLEQLAALLPGVAATQLDSGVLSADVNGVRYVLQPGIGVHLGAASGSAQLPLGGDGYFHFVDTLGNDQVLYPAFAEPATLRSILQGMDFRATVNIALDGTATIDFNGQRYTLVPELTLAPVPAEHAGQDWWQESDTRYRLVNWQSLPLRSVSQGFTVRP